MNPWIELATVVAEVATALYFFSNLFKEKEKLRPIEYIFIVVYGLILFLLSYFSPATLMHLLLTIMLTYGLVKFAFHSGWLEAVYPTFIFLFSSIVLEILCGAILSVSGFSLNDLMGGGNARIAYSIMEKLLHLLALYIILQFTNHRYEKAMLINMLPLISCIGLSFFICFRSFTLLLYGVAPVDVIFQTFAILYINILICVYVETLNKAYIKQHQAEQIGQLLKIKESYYNEVVLKQDQTRALWHDIEKYVAAMETLVAHENRSEAKEYLTKIRSRLSNTQNFFDTGNTMIDSILSYEVDKAKASGVRILCQIWVSNILNIPAPDLFVIIGNTLDNAIEAVAMIEDSEKRIVNVTLHQKNHILTYETTNNIPPTYHKKSGNLHGYGLKNVKELVERNSGYITITNENSNYTISIRLNV